MTVFYRIGSVFIVVLVLFSCKNEPKQDTTELRVPLKVEKKELSAEEKKQTNSVMTKAMVTPELKTFSSFLVSTQLTSIIVEQDGPFTLLAPSNEAFAKIPKEKNDALIHRSNKEKLIALMKGHIVLGNLDSVQLVQEIKKNGTLTLKTLSGATLTASLKGNNIVITDSLKNKAIIGKSDIKGSNGVVHILDAVLGVD